MNYTDCYNGQLNFSASIILENKLFCVSQCENLLVEIDMRSFAVLNTVILKGIVEDVECPRSYHLFSYGTKIYVIWKNSSSINVYDRFSKEQFEIQLPIKDNVNIENAYVYSDKIYIFHYNMFEEPLVVDLKGYAVSRLLWYKNCIKKIYRASWKKNCWRMQLVDNAIWTVVAEESWILKIDLLNCKVNIFEIDGKYKLHSLFIDGDTFWATLIDCNDVLCGTIQDKKAIINKKYFSNENRKCHFPYFRILKIDKEILLLTHELSNDSIGYFLTYNNQMEKISVPEDYVSDYSEIVKTGRFHTNVLVFDGKIFFCPEASNYMVHIENGIGDLVRINRVDCFSSNQVANYYLKKMLQDNIVHEQDHKLEDFMFLLGKMN